jgi:hypothetical protein
MLAAPDSDLSGNPRDDRNSNHWPLNLNFWFQLLLVSFCYEEPARQHCTQARRQQRNGADVAHVVCWPEFGLVNLRSNNTHQLATRIGHSNGEAGRCGASRCSDPLWPDDSKERLRGCSRNHNEYVLGNGLFDCNEQNVTNDLYNLNTKPSDPRRKTFRGYEVCQTTQYHKDECKRRLTFISSCASWVDNRHTIVIIWDIAVFDMPNS